MLTKMAPGERLCHIGASEILMPQDILTEYASSADPSCGTEILRLGRLFEVSAQTMTLRVIRETSLWAVSWRCAPGRGIGTHEHPEISGIVGDVIPLHQG